MLPASTRRNALRADGGGTAHGVPKQVWVRPLDGRVAQPIPLGRVPSFNILHRLTLLVERVIELHSLYIG